MPTHIQDYQDAQCNACSCRVVVPTGTKAAVVRCRLCFDNIARNHAAYDLAPPHDLVVGHSPEAFTGGRFATPEDEARAAKAAINDNYGRMVAYNQTYAPPGGAPSPARRPAAPAAAGAERAPTAAARLRRAFEGMNMETWRFVGVLCVVAFLVGYILGRA